MLPLLTAYDPLGGSSTSIDPLGSLQTYGALADLLLPGITTITARSRYLSMLCAALANAEKHQKFLPGASGLGQRRKAVEPFERLWALACVAAKHHQFDDLAADGLRGYRSANRAYLSLSSRKKKASPDYRMLKYQSRTGAVGTYWTALIGGELANADKGSLEAEGRELAQEFPEPPLTARDCARLADPAVSHRVSMPFDDLVDWAEACHLKAAGSAEREQIADALTAHDRRDCIARALLTMAEAGDLPEVWDMDALEQLKSSLNSIGRAVELGLPTVIEAVLVTERFHEAVLTVFQSLLWWGTQHSDKSLTDLIEGKEMRQATERCRDTAQQLQQFRKACDQEAICKAITSMMPFACAIEGAATPRLVVDELLYRHRHVQLGKVNGEGPKREWIVVTYGKVLRPAPRFQRSEPPSPARGITLTHPYRLEPFTHMLYENAFLPMLDLEGN